MCINAKHHAAGLHLDFVGSDSPRHLFVLLHSNPLTNNDIGLSML
jgi:hypothetical protein